MKGQWAIEPISKAHDRGHFDCGETSLNEYLKRYARQNAEMGISKTYVAVRPPSTRVAGFYSISTGSIEFDELPPEAARRLPKYPVPTAHLARLAVAKAEQGLGLGGVLLYDALERTARVADQIGIFAVTVDALHARARSFYLRYGFEPLRGDDLHLYLLLDTVRKLMR